MNQMSPPKKPEARIRHGKSPDANPNLAQTKKKALEDYVAQAEIFADAFRREPIQPVPVPDGEAAPIVNTTSVSAA